MTVQRFATPDLTRVEWSKTRDTDDDGWLSVTFRSEGVTHTVHLGPIPEDVLRGALADPELPPMLKYPPAWSPLVRDA